MIRWLTGVAGGGLALYGVFRLLTQIPVVDLLILAGWLAGALLLHDGVLAPLTAAAGAALDRHVPPRLRRYAQGGLVAAACVTVVALPMIFLEGSQPPQKALLRQHYVTNLAILVGLVAAGTTALYLVRALRDRHDQRDQREPRASAAKVRPSADHTSSTR